MRVDFRADVDLAKLAYKKNSTVLAISLFCGTDNPDLSIGPPTVYLQGQPLLQGKWGQATQSEASSSPGSREYHFFFNVARRENFKSKPPQRGYDLRRNPEDICFYLTGGKPGWFGFKFKSRVATILKSDIAEAFLGITTARCFSADQRRRGAERTTGARRTIAAGVCRREGLSAWSLYEWRSRLRARREAQTTTTPATTPTSFIDFGALEPGGSRCAVRIELGGGVAHSGNPTPSGPTDQIFADHSAHALEAT